MKRYAGAVMVVVVIILSGNSIKAQQIDFITDLNIINKKLSEKLPDPYKRPYIYKDEPSLIKKINPVNIIVWRNIVCLSEYNIKTNFLRMPLYSKLFRVQ